MSVECNRTQQGTQCHWSPSGWYWLFRSRYPFVLGAQGTWPEGSGERHRGHQHQWKGETPPQGTSQAGPQGGASVEGQEVNGRHPKNNFRRQWGLVLEQARGVCMNSISWWGLRKWSISYFNITIYCALTEGQTFCVHDFLQKSWYGTGKWSGGVAEHVMKPDCAGKFTSQLQPLLCDLRQVKWPLSGL